MPSPIEVLETNLIIRVSSKPLYLLSHFSSPTLSTPLRSQTFFPNVAFQDYTLMTLPVGSGAWGVNESTESLFGAWGWGTRL